MTSAFSSATLLLRAGAVLPAGSLASPKAAAFQKALIRKGRWTPSSPIEYRHAKPIHDEKHEGRLESFLTVAGWRGQGRGLLEVLLLLAPPRLLSLVLLELLLERPQPGPLAVEAVVLTGPFGFGHVLGRG
jgi:hypothetical protein